MHRERKRYRILYPSSFSHMIGGGQWSLYYLIKHLNKDMFRSIVLCPGEGEFAEKMKSVGAEVICFDVGRIRYLNPLVIKKFISIIRNKHIDLIHKRDLLCRHRCQVDADTPYMAYPG
jgi:hypothetical protein